MALITCGECGKEISDKATSCVHCGCPILSNRESDNNNEQSADKIKEINGRMINIDELVRESRGNDEAMANRLKFLTKISGSEAKRITEIAYKNRNIKPIGFIQKVSERTIVCRKCGSRNISFSIEQYGEFSRSKGTLKPSGKKAKYKEKSSSFAHKQTVGICQDCGKTWTKW